MSISVDHVSATILTPAAGAAARPIEPCAGAPGGGDRAFARCFQDRLEGRGQRSETDVEQRRSAPAKVDNPERGEKGEARAPAVDGAEEETSAIEPAAEQGKTEVSNSETADVAPRPKSADSSQLQVVDCAELCSDTQLADMETCVSADEQPIAAGEQTADGDTGVDESGAPSSDVIEAISAADADKSLPGSPSPGASADPDTGPARSLASPARPLASVTSVAEALPAQTQVTADGTIAPPTVRSAGPADTDAAVGSKILSATDDIGVPGESTPVSKNDPAAGIKTAAAGHPGGAGQAPAGNGLQAARGEAVNLATAQAPAGEAGKAAKSAGPEAEARLADTVARSTTSTGAEPPPAPGAGKITTTSEPATANFTAIGGRVSVPVNVRFGTEPWAGHVAERTAQLAYHNIQSAQLQLDPPELGPLTVKIQVQQDQAVVHFVANSAQVKEALDGTMAKLRDLLSEQGIDLLEANVRDQSEQRGGRERKGFAPHGGFATDQTEAPEDMPPRGSVTLSSGIDYFA